MKTSLPIPDDEESRRIVNQIEHNNWLEEYAQDMYEIRIKRERKAGKRRT